MAAIFGCISEGLAQHENVLAQVRLFDEGVGPELAHQLVFGDDLAIIPEQDEESLENLWSDRDRSAPAQQELLLRVDPEFAELVQKRGISRHLNTNVVALRVGL